MHMLNFFAQQAQHYFDYIKHSLKTKYKYIDLTCNISADDT